MVRCGGSARKTAVGSRRFAPQAPRGSREPHFHVSLSHSRISSLCVCARAVSTVCEYNLDTVALRLGCNVRDEPLRQLIVAVNRQCGVNGCVDTTSIPSRSGCKVGYQPLRQLIVAVNRQCSVNGRVNTTSMPSRSGGDVGDEPLRQLIVAVKR